MLLVRNSEKILEELAHLFVLKQYSNNHHHKGPYQTTRDYGWVSSFTCYQSTDPHRVATGYISPVESD